MKATLISVSEPVDPSWGSDALELIAYCARVSNPSNQNNHESAEKLVNYLIKHKHWSPLEMVSACIEVETTRDIARQLLRHRSFSFQEFSQRYADVGAMNMNDMAWRELRMQDHKNRQNSIELKSPRLEALWTQQQARVKQAALDAYNWAIQNDIAKEVARAVLPEGLTPSRLYVNGTLRSWVHYIELRSGNGTQKEHMELAKACGEAISKIFPYEGLLS